MLLLKRINRHNVLRRIKNILYYCLSESKSRSYIASEQFLRHITLIVKIAYIGRRQSEHRHIREHKNQFPDIFHPLVCACTVEFVEYHYIRGKVSDLLICHAHELLIGDKDDVLRLPVVRISTDVFQLGSEDLLRRR